MATLCNTFPTAESAVRAAARLADAGVPAGDIGVLIGHRYDDVRAERIGGFSGAVEPDAPFGKYAGPPRPRWRAAGGFIAHPDEHRQGSFGDIDRILAVDFNGGVHVKTTDDEHALRLLARARVPDEVARQATPKLHRGQAVLFVRLTDVDLKTVEALIDQTGAA